MFMLIGVCRKRCLVFGVWFLSLREGSDGIGMGVLLTPAGIFHSLYNVGDFSFTRGNRLLAGEDILRVSLTTAAWTH